MYGSDPLLAGVACTLLRSSQDCATHYYLLCLTWVLHVCCCPAVRAVLAERGDDPALAAATAEQLAAELAAGEGSKLKSVMQVRSTQKVTGNWNLG